MRAVASASNDPQWRRQIPLDVVNLQVKIPIAAPGQRARRSRHLHDERRGSLLGELLPAYQFLCPQGDGRQAFFHDLLPVAGDHDLLGFANASLDGLSTMKSADIA